MALGDLIVFDKTKNNISGLLDLSNDSDFSAMIITTLPVAGQTTPDSADFVEVTAGGNYAGPIALTTSWALIGTETVFKVLTPSPLEILSAAGSPTNCKAILIYSETAVGEDAVCAIDLTADGGTTAHSLVDGKIAWTPNANGLFKF